MFLLFCHFNDFCVLKKNGFLGLCNYSVHGTRKPIWVPPQSWINFIPESHALALDWSAKAGTDWIDSGGDQVRSGPGSALGKNCKRPGISRIEMCFRNT